MAQLNFWLDTMSAVENHTNGLSHEIVVPSQDREKIDLALRTIRCLVADLCEQYKGGHPGYVRITSIPSHEKEGKKN